MNNVTVLHGNVMYDNTHIGDSAELPAPTKGNLYVAGPMRGYKNFNVDAFDSASTWLRQQGYVVLNPCDKDRAEYGDAAFQSETGDLKDIAHLGFNLNHALAWDLDYIAKQATGIALLPGWEDSSGARAEKACADALGKNVYFLSKDKFGRWFLPTPVERAEVIGRNRAKAIDKVYAKASTSGEVRTVSSSGGEKGMKPARFSLLPTGALTLIAEHFGKGAAKYADHNWRRGYEWGKSYDALCRHLNAFWSGEDIDEETGSHHLAAAGFHVLALLTYTHDDRYAEFDDRYKAPSKIERILAKA